MWLLMMLLAADGQDDLLTLPRPDLVPMIIHADPIAIVEAITASNMPSGGGTHTNTSLQIVEVLRGRAKGTIEARTAAASPRGDRHKMRREQRN